MGKPTESKRRKFSHLNDAEAEKRRKIVNQQERVRQLKISEAYKELYDVLPKTENIAGLPSKLAILTQAKEYILQLQSGANTVNKGSNQELAVLCPNGSQQENTGLEQTSQYLGLPATTELPHKKPNFLENSSLVASGSDQIHWSQEVNFPQCSFYQRVNQPYMHNGSGYQDSSNFHQNGNSSSMDSSDPFQFLPALNSSIDNITDPQGFQTHIQPVVFCDQSPIPTFANNFTSSNQTDAFQGVNGRVGSFSTLNFVAQTPQNVPGKGFTCTSI